MTVTTFDPSRRLIGLAAAAALAGVGLPALAQKAAPAAAAKPLQGQVVKMVRIDPLSGLLGPVGVSQRKGYEFFAEKFSATNPAGVKFEMSFIDNKLSPTESLWGRSAWTAPNSRSGTAPRSASTSATCRRTSNSSTAP